MQSGNLFPKVRTRPVDKEEIMEIVRVTETDEVVSEDQGCCDATKAWFKIDFVPREKRAADGPRFGRPCAAPPGAR